MSEPFEKIILFDEDDSKCIKMIHLLNVEEWAERYEMGDLSPQELKDLHNTLEEDVVLNKAFEQALQIQVMLKEHKKKAKLKSKIALIATQHQAQSQSQIAQGSKAIVSKANNLLMKVKRNWKPLSAAAAIALFSSLFTYTLTSKSVATKNTQYVLLKRDLETLKKSQNQLIKDIKYTTAKNNVETNPGLFGGSGFALSNDGYFATNYHVVEKADSVYLQLNNGNAYRASVIKVNPESDLAILKIDDPKFTFKQPIPYLIDKRVGLLGQTIYSIGFPKDEVVYNEGYISSEKGYDGNATSYQLEITANPGQSGAPILDNKGNIVGIITGKQSNTSGTTFAVHADQLLSMVGDLSKENKVTLNSKNKYSSISRPEQVKMLRDYVCAVRVY